MANRKRKASQPVESVKGSTVEAVRVAKRAVSLDPARARYEARDVPGVDAGFVVQHLGAPGG